MIVPNQNHILNTNPVNRSSIDECIYIHIYTWTDALHNYTLDRFTSVCRKKIVEFTSAYPLIS